MKSLLELWHLLAASAASICDTDTSLDFKTVQSRVETEGESYLLISLPNFGKDFERSLDRSKVDSNSFKGYARMKGSPLPRFLAGLMSQVFNPETGVIHDEPSVDAVMCIRQLTHVFGKVERPTSDARTNAAYAQYIMTDRMVETWMRDVAIRPKGRSYLSLQYPGLTLGYACRKPCANQGAITIGRPDPRGLTSAHWHVAWNLNN